MRLLILTAAWAFGISIARALPALDILPWVIAAVLAAAGTVVALSRNALRNLCLVLLFIAAGAARQSLVPRSSEIAAYNGYTGTVTGTVIAEPVARDDRIQIRLDSETIFVNSRDEPTSGLVLVEATVGAKAAYGDRVRATGALDHPGAGDSFSYADYLGRQGVFSIMRNAGLEVISQGHGNPGIATLLELKHIARRIIAEQLPEPQGGLLTGILLGDDSGLSPELEEAFERVGASHVIAISGFNMVVVSAIVLRLLSSAMGGRSAAATGLAVAVIVAYSIFVGASPSILRAALMSVLLVIGNQLQRRTFVPTSLAFAALCLSMLDPNILLDIGFQLSFFAVLGLGLFVEPLSERFQSVLHSVLPLRIAKPFHSFLNEPLIVTFAAQIATLPLVILYFGRLSILALPVNMLIVPVQAAALMLGFFAVGSYVFAPAIGTLVFWVDLLFLSWTIEVVRAFARLEFAEILVDLDGRVIQVSYLLLLGYAMVNAARPRLWTRLQTFLRMNIVVTSIGVSAFIALVLMWSMICSRPDGMLHVWFLDVGHSNAILMQMPGGAHVLVDGGRFRARLLTAIGDRLPFYDRQIEMLFITQPDEWDIAAISAVLQRYGVSAWMYHGQVNRSEVLAQIQGRLKRMGAKLVEARAGATVDFGDGARIDVLHPRAAPAIGDKLGDSVLVLRVSYGDASFLLTSDLSAAGQRDMLARGISPSATVMQIPQHGTARAIDSEFLELAQPQVAVLQTDIANRRGDPDPDTLAKLNGLRLFRTDEQGAVHIFTDGKTLEIN